ncbi:MAG TPA: hypothetical protein VFP65_12565 [Anaeromyxobacteraceae bacterium]|nr:hypothetical protein [Anaeromyxobacteraceae bacterium]
MAATGVGLLLEEHRGEITAAWREAVERELGVKDPALAFAIAPLLRELTLALGGEGDPRRSREAWKRCAVLVRSNASPGQLAREMKVLHRAAWDALRARGAPVSQADRRAADEWLDEALAEALDRLERVRQRVASLEAHAPVVIPARALGASARPPPLPRAGRGPVPATRPPPAARRSAEEEPILELEPIAPGSLR